ncbi:MAG: M3 family oligoendopeptidase [Lachnospiraceae bacterium]|nr:M3 family oligoendopeptidase [Lachnospiraceae bacterium]
MKFSEYPYERPDTEALKSKISVLSAKLKEAADYSAVKDAFLGMDQLEKKIHTLSALSYIRHSLDTKDEFYDAEQKFWNAAGPELQEYTQQFKRIMMESPFRPELEEEFGSIVFKYLELEIRSFSPEIISCMQQENDLVQEYNKLIAEAKVEFEGKIYPIPMMTPFKKDPDDARRLAAWKAEGRWYKDHQADLDRIYDNLVHLRDTMGKTLGHKDYTELGYDRMERVCYRRKDVEKFRKAVRKHLVPVADSIYRKQAERLGMPYPLSFADMALEFRDGNPSPVGDEEQILANGQAFYDALSPETGSFFRMMRENELLDVFSREGKENGGYCEGLPSFGVPFIFANFNGTQGDVEVVTHEAGHAFAYYLNKDRVPESTIWPGMEACEVHSMSMEFFAWPWAETFFGKDTQKYLYSHLASALTFIPYGTLVDHFQHEVYEKPEMTPQERHNVWKELLGVYMPWVRLDGEIPFYSDGEGWQRQLHIYNYPFYYIDYCLAQTVSLEFWAMIQKDLKEAWRKYRTYAGLGGSEVFTELLRKSGLQSPFDEECLKNVSKEAALWLENFRF